MRKVIFKSSFFVFIVITLFLNGCNNENKNGTTVVSKEDSLKQQLERGKYLVYSVVNCVNCHSHLDFNKFSAPIVKGTEGGGGLAVHELEMGFPGKLFVPNITPYALKDWTDAEIARAMTKGINQKGDTLFPMMPYHAMSNMAKEDVDAVIAYIRTLKPVEGSYPKKELAIPLSLFGPLPDNDYKNNIKPDTADKVKYGGYLVSIAHCTECHTQFTPDFKPDFTKLFAGGREVKTPGFTVRVANITPDTATGIGGWTEEMFLTKFRTNASPENINRNPGKLNTIMPWSFFGTMKDNDLKSIYAYLRTLPPVKNLVEKWPK